MHEEQQYLSEEEIQAEEGGITPVYPALDSFEIEKGFSFLAKGLGIAFDYVKGLLGGGEDTEVIEKGWKVGDNVYKLTARGNEPSWTTVRNRFWKNQANDTNASDKWGAENIERMRKGYAPQRYNADKGGVESMELSHEPIPFRDGGKDFIPRWPQDHAAIDPFRHPGY